MISKFINKKVMIFLTATLIFYSMAVFIPKESVVHATGLPNNGIQNFTNYSTSTLPFTSPDGSFTISAKKTDGTDRDRFAADQFGAYINDYGLGVQETVYFEIKASGALGSFELDSVGMGEYNQGYVDNTIANQQPGPTFPPTGTGFWVKGGDFTVTVKGYANGVEVFSTTPYREHDENFTNEHFDEIDYSVADGKKIDSFRVYYTMEADSYSIHLGFNLLNFTIAGVSTSAPPSATPLDTVTNVLLGVDGEASWDNVAHESSYSVQLYKNGVALGSPITKNADETSHNFLTDIQTAGAGTYTVKVVAKGDGTTYSDSLESAASSGMKKLATVSAGLTWTGNVAKWTAVADAVSYAVQLYKDGTAVGSAVTATDATAGVDFSSAISTNGAGTYKYKVTAKGNTTLILDGEESAFSADKVVATPLPKVEGVSLSEAGEASWTDSANESSYEVQLYKDGSPVGTAVSKTAGTTSHDFLSAMRTAGVGTYTVKVVAKGNGTTSSDSQASEVSESRIVTKLATVDTASLTWDGNTAKWTDVSSAVSYDVQLYKNGSAIESVVTATDGTAGVDFSTAISTNGAGTYTYKVTAKADSNTKLTFDANTSEASAEKILAIAGKPTNVSATAGDGQATVIFTVPSNNGGSTITGYKVKVYKADGTALTLLDKIGTASPIIVTGLTNGTAYKFTVVATNALGDSVESTVTSTVTPSKVPDAPTAVSATGGNGKADITFTVPTNDGGNPITSYKVKVFAGGVEQTALSTTVDVASITTTPATAMITGLTNGTAYTFKVVATNAVGDSEESTASEAVTPKTVPDAPTNTSATAGNGQATVTFTQPTNGGSAITGYIIKAYTNGTTEDTALLTTVDVASITTTPATVNVTGLTNGAAYTFKVIAVNVVGESTESTATVAVTPMGTQTTPTGLTGVAPTSSANNDGQITGVTTSPLMEYKLSTGSTWIDVIGTNITDLPAGTYEVRYKATTNKNASPSTSVTVPAYTAPGGGGGGSTPTEPTTPTLPPTEPKTEQIVVDVAGTNGNNLAQTPIERKTESTGKVTDTVKMEESIAKDTVEKAKEQKIDTARIVIPDKEDKVAETRVDVPKNAIVELAKGALNLAIETEGVVITVPKTSLEEIQTDDLFFRVVPIKLEAERKQVEERANKETVVQLASQGQTVSIVGRPMTIETNMKNKPVDLVLPLTGVTLPTDPIKKEAFLTQLGVYIEHSDGEKVLRKGEVVTLPNGQQGLKFTVNKFSTFTIVYAEGLKEVTEDKAWLTVGYKTGDRTTNVTQNITLPTTGPSGSAITWSSDKPQFIAPDGTVQRPTVAQGDQIVTLTATIKNGTVAETKVFTVTVKATTASEPVVPTPILKDVVIEKNGQLIGISRSLYNNALGVQKVNVADVKYIMLEGNYYSKTTYNAYLALGNPVLEAFKLLIASPGHAQPIFPLEGAVQNGEIVIVNKP